MTNTEIVLKFISHWNNRDLEAILSCFTDNAIYHNIPVDPVTGPEAIRGVIDSFTQGVDKIHWDVIQIAENANSVVLTERTDNFIFANGKISLPVMGAFEIENGKISHWRDYFDMAQFQTQMAKITE